MDNYWSYATLFYICLLIFTVSTIFIWDLHEIFWWFVAVEAFIITFGLLFVFGYEKYIEKCDICYEKRILMPLPTNTGYNVCSDCYVCWNEGKKD